MSSYVTTMQSQVSGTYENVTKAGVAEKQAYLVDVAQKLVMCCILIFMTGVGCSLDPKQIAKYVRRPKEFITGLFLQLFAMPLVGLAITQMLQMDIPEALGVTIQSIAPGGGFSILVTYWMDGDMNLSAVLTSTSTLLAFGSMPLWLFVISNILKLEQEFLIPYVTVGIAVVSTVVPIIIGVVIQHFFPRIAPKITKISSIIASVGALTAFALNGVAGAYDFPFSYKLFLAGIFLITTAVLFGYAASRVPWLNLEPSSRRAIAIETAFQNTPVAFSIIVLTFGSADAEVLGPMSFFPLLYGLLVLLLSAVAVIIYKILIAKGVKCLSPVNSDDAAKTGEENGAADALVKA